MSSSLRFLARYQDFGLLVLRVGLGAMFIGHGLPKLLGGPSTWTKVGAMALAPLGIHFIPVFWGFVAAMVEALGGLLLILGFFFRPACIFLAIQMAIALTMHLSHHDAFVTWSHAAEDGIVFLSLILIGPGRHSIDGR